MSERLGKLSLGRRFKWESSEESIVMT